MLVSISVCILLFASHVSAAAIKVLDREIKSDHESVVCQGAGKVVDDPAEVNSLRVVSIIFRHGDRTPIYLWPTDPHKNLSSWPEGWEELTALGKEQLLTLGKYFRQRYGNWLEEKFTPQAIHILSSDIDRTIMSADAAMNGLFPPISKDQSPENQFVPVHTLPQDIDNVTDFTQKILFSANCNRYNANLKALLKSEPDIEFNSANQELYNYLSQQTGLNVTDYNAVYSIYDTLFIQTCRNLPLPSWTKSVFPGKMKSSVVQYFQSQTRTDEMRLFFTGPLWTNILTKIEKASAFVGVVSSNSSSVDININAPPPPTPNLYMFSGHDSTVAGLLDSIGALKEIPQYASSFILEVHEHGNTAQVYVKVFFRNDLDQKAIEIPLNCPSSPCSYPDFLQIVGKYRLSQNEWERLCSVNMTGT